MAKIKKIITAGPYQKVVLYSRGHRSDPPKVRAAKRRASSEAQKRLNLKNSREKLKLLLAANFPTARSGVVVTFTYSDEFLPPSKKQANALMNEFRKLLRRERKRRGKELVMVSNVEQDSAQNGRLHHHGVINATGDDYDEIRRCWKWGAVEFEAFRLDKEKNWDTLAAYLTKEPPDELGRHSWSATRNCKKPEIETFTVSDDTTLQPPSGSHLISSERHTDEFASWESIEFVWPGGVRPPRAKRRRK